VKNTVAFNGKLIVFYKQDNNCTFAVLIPASGPCSGRTYSLSLYDFNRFSDMYKTQGLKNSRIEVADALRGNLKQKIFTHIYFYYLT